MKRISYIGLAAVLVAVGLVWRAAPSAGDCKFCPGSTPNPNSAKIVQRKFNDCPTSTLVVNNVYPALISISDQNLDCFGFANLHTWGFSSDGGLNYSPFENCSYYRFCANVVMTGTGNGEGGLRLGSWWDPDIGGKFMLNTGSGEIAAFDARLPFYSFTVNFGVTYVKGVNAFMEMIYTPNALSAALPATIEYHLSLGGGPLLSSGPLNFDEGNVAEGLIHGNWGELCPASPGGYFQPYLGQGQDVGLTATFADICYQNLGATPTAPSSWGRLKTLYR